jgi:chemotaxis protein MotB
MAKKKKEKHQENHIDETWLIPYADLLTLLLALFIVLFSMSSIDAQKFRQLAQTFNSAFDGGTGALNYPSPLPVEPAQSINREDNKKNITPMTEKQSLEQLKAKIDNYIKANNLQGELDTKLTDEGLLITILNDILFDSGSAKVRVKDEKIAREVSNLLVMNPPRNIIISGHTDNVPIHNSQFESNWHLSVMRAVNFMKILLENEKLDPRWFSAKGYGEYKPVASNNTEEGRMKNRRVEVLILPNQ